MSQNIFHFNLWISATPQADKLDGNKLRSTYCGNGIVVIIHMPSFSAKIAFSFEINKCFKPF